MEHLILSGSIRCGETFLFFHLIEGDSEPVSNIT